MDQIAFDPAVTFRNRIDQSIATYVDAFTRRDAEALNALWYPVETVFFVAQRLSPPGAKVALQEVTGSGSL